MLRPVIYALIRLGYMQPITKSPVGTGSNSLLERAPARDCS